MSKLVYARLQNCGTVLRGRTSRAVMLGVSYSAHYHGDNGFIEYETNMMIYIKDHRRDRFVSTMVPMMVIIEVAITTSALDLSRELLRK